MLVIEKAPIPITAVSISTWRIRGTARYVHSNERIKDRDASIERQLRNLRGRELPVRIPEDSYSLVLQTGCKRRCQDAVVASLLDGVLVHVGVVEVNRLGHDQVLRLFVQDIGRRDHILPPVGLVA